MQVQNHSKQREDGNILKGMAAGLIGGLVASFVMEAFQSFLSATSKSNKEESQGSKSSAKKGRQKKGQQSNKSKEEQETATVKAASAISEGVFDHKLKKNEKKAAGEAVHYAMGGTSGAIYGVMAEMAPLVSKGVGIPFGTVLWLIADDVAVPAASLSKPPTEYPPSTHAYALASHCVYGLTADLVRRAVRRAL